MTLAREGGRLSGKSALIAGASRGIGEAAARSLAGGGANVILAARSETRLLELADELGGSAIPLDLTDHTTTTRAMASFVEEHGAPDIVVNAAGVFDVAAIHETELELLERNLDVNLGAAFRLLKCLLPAMLERGGGLIVNVGSVAGRRAFPGNAAYAASKFGLRGLHEVLVEEVRGTGVRACLIEPSATDTSIWDPMDPDNDPTLPDRAAMLKPSDVAEAILFVCSRADTVQIPLLQIARS